MNFEALIQGLQAVVQEAFVLEDHEKELLEQEVNGHNGIAAVQALKHQLNHSKVPGLKQNLMESYCSGDIEAIRRVEKVAHAQAASGYMLKLCNDRLPKQRSPRRGRHSRIKLNNWSNS